MISLVLIKCIVHFSSLSSSFILAAVYTYYKTLCQEATLKRKGAYDQRRTQRRRRERIVRVRVVSQFNPKCILCIVRSEFTCTSSAYYKHHPLYFILKCVHCLLSKCRRLCMCRCECVCVHMSV